MLTHGAVDRLMILMPPGSAKSTYASILFPSWWFTQHPRSSVIVVSHSAALANYFGRRVQALVAAKAQLLGIALRSNNRASDAWGTTAGGEFLGIGIRGAIAGRRADLIIIDDPIGSFADADSAQQRDYLWEWFRGDLTTRLRPGGKIVLVMTRWHADDLAGRLLAKAADEWRIVRLPALAERDDPLGRAEGAPLWPDWESHKALLRKRELVGERMWNALFQQSPRAVAGSLFALDKLAVVADHEIRAPLATVRAWDLAATAASGQNDPDWTAGVKLGLLSDNRYIILDVVRIRGTPREVEELIVNTARRDGADVTVAIPEDPGQAGKSQTSYLIRQLAGFAVVSSRESGAKSTRAMPLASQIEAGNVLVACQPWNHLLFDELQDFPYGRKDDQVDALVRAFVTLTNRSHGAKWVPNALFQR